MPVQINSVPLEEVKPFRALFLQENNFQFILNKAHDYGWADTWLFVMDEVKIGYGSVWGSNRREDRDTIFEFYLLPPFRKFSSQVFAQFQALVNTDLIEAQTNDPLLTSMLYEFAHNIQAEAILFDEHITTHLSVPGVSFRKSTADDAMNGDDSDYVLEKNGEIVASGGLMLNYNFPYADIYMQVKEPFRQQGMGAFLVQELKKLAYEMGRVPAARCNINNPVSRSTLLKAGFKVCGFRLKGDCKKTAPPPDK